MLFEAAEEAELVRDYLWQRRNGLAPWGGGRLEQSPRYLVACDVVEAELARREVTRG